MIREELIPLIPIVEAILFVADEPLSTDRIQNLLAAEFLVNRQEIEEIMNRLKNAYHDRGIELVEVATGYRFQSKKQFSSWIQRLVEKKPVRYSRAFLETLALIVYRQPITRGEIEEVRGVTVNVQIIKSLLEREWIRVVGHKDLPGKPALFGTTKKFLDDFNLKNLNDLPLLPNPTDLELVGRQLELSLSEQLDTSLSLSETPAAAREVLINE